MKKKIISIALAAVTLVCLSGCGGSGEAREAITAASAAENSASAEMTLNAQQDMALLVSAEEDGDVHLVWTDNGSECYLVSRVSVDETETLVKVGAGEELEYTDVIDNMNGVYHYVVQGYTDASLQVETSVAEVEYKNGFVFESGILLCYENGTEVRDAEVNGLYFGSDGVYTSGDSELDAQVAEIIGERTDDGMTQLERLESLYNWVIVNFSYESMRFADTSDANWENQWAKDFFTSGQGNCFSYAAAVTVLARAVGFEARVVYGSCNQTYQWVDHAWTEILYENETYICDAEMEGVFARNRNLDWDLFMKPYGETVTIYEAY